jgi:hypothetical protein
MRDCAGWGHPGATAISEPTTTVEELARIARAATHKAGGVEAQHDPNDYCCLCERCDLERWQAAILARARSRTADDDFAGNTSNDVTVTERHHRR